MDTKKKTSKKKVVRKKKTSKKVETVKGLKVENEDAVRDSNSGAIVFNNQSKYQQAVRRKRQNLTNKKNDSELRKLKREIASLTNLVNQLINSKD